MIKQIKELQKQPTKKGDGGGKCARCQLQKKDPFNIALSFRRGFFFLNDKQDNRKQ